MAPDEVLLLDGFTLMDAMSAFEVRAIFVLVDHTVSFRIDRRASYGQRHDLGGGQETPIRPHCATAT